MLPSGYAERLSQLPRLVFYHSRNDDEVPVSHVDRYAAALPTAIVRKVDGRGHLFDHGNVADIVEDIRGRHI
jgi:predicted alpha/beta hydrolase family esterase